MNARIRFRHITVTTRQEPPRVGGCNDYMARSTQVRISANLLLAAYRKLAISLAYRRQSKGRPTLSDVFSGEVTKQLIKADQVTPEEVENLMAETRRNRDNS